MSDIRDLLFDDESDSSNGVEEQESSTPKEDYLKIAEELDILASDDEFAMDIIKIAMLEEFFRDLAKEGTNGKDKKSNN